MDVFLTGGSGSTGGTVIRRLVADGHTVHALARSASAAKTVTAAGAQPIPGDLTDLGPTAGTPAWLSVLAEVDAVVHAAAHMEFWGPDQLFVDRNLVPTRALYQAAVAAHVKRFVLLSAASVSTGDNHAVTVNEDSPIGKPNIAYSRVKLRTEQELLALPHGETALVVLRPPFIWGPNMANLQGFVDSVEAGRFSWIDGGQHKVDFCHVENLAHAITLAATRGEHGLVCYITDDDPRPAREFFVPLLATRGVDVSKAGSFPRALASPVATLLETVAKARRSTTPPPITHWIVSFMGRDRVYDITRARTRLGYRPVITVEEGLRRLAEA
ncbi:3-beta hydroxysteroid dehydrogenase [Paractinoplanes abujensis]|uniref:Nucleoside-diphosphate-sugar epimerase n=1 Tax=Paractinoplanes abujensis TaxID=882441 RepID=A0A7W7CTW4_9ACTN|nr:NAD(P)-dependent oxidoreductase [Actinoplanes abujensis]MBB4694619.1 nucleoside-diphosphate-sugar epimerase [Actinoplanes abujensis]GID20167.1 3-beta hydroxysteroid dehydrogenase [Actinoplanes abujensis]